MLFYANNPTTLGGVPFITWAFPLGTDVGATREGEVAMNIIAPEDRCYIGIQNSDAAKDINHWELEMWGVDMQ